MSSSEEQIPLEKEKLSSSSHSGAFSSSDTTTLSHDHHEESGSSTTSDEEANSSSMSQEQKSGKVQHSCGDRCFFIFMVCFFWVLLLGMAVGFSYTIVNDSVPATVYQCQLEHFTMNFSITSENVTITHNYLWIANETWRNSTSNRSSTDIVWHLARTWNLVDGEHECTFSTSGDYAEQPFVQEIGTYVGCYTENQDECRVTFTEPYRNSMTFAIAFASTLSLLMLGAGICLTFCQFRDYRKGKF